MATIISINNKQVNYQYFKYAIILTFVCLWQQNGCVGLKLPEYIKPCSLSDSNLNECIKTHAQEALTNFANGDAKYHIPSLKPMEINEIILDGTNTIKLKLTNVKLSGLDTIIFTSGSFNKNDTHNEFKLKLSLPALYSISDYEMTGQISVVPISGKGPSNITLVNCEAETEHLFDTKQRKGNEHLHFVQNDIQFECKRVYFDMKNLFGGNDNLSGELNKLLNQNWELILNDLKPAIVETMKEIMRTIFTGYVNRVPKEDFFLP